MQTGELAEIYRLVNETPEAERDALLDSACNGDAEARAEIERLLGEHEIPSAAELLQRDCSVDSIGPHRIVRRIASGSMGDVYEAQQTEPRRRVAIKVLRHEALNEKALARFHREAEILARLKHPGIAHIHAFGSTRDERPYIVMELIEGPQITHRACDLTLGERIERVAKVCDAVDYAHRNGVIHRDLKPANVLVTSDGDPKVLDFGVARSITADITQTLDGSVIGTLAYMSPEQARGAGVDTRSDIYALGVLAHEIIAGRHPMDGGGAAVTLRALVTSEELPCDVKGDLGVVIAKAMSVEADHRYPSAAGLAQDLRRAAQGEPVHASPPHPYRIIRRFMARQWLPVSLAIAVVVALAVGYVIALRGEESALRLAARAEVRVAEAALRDDDPSLALHHLRRVPERLRFWEWRFVQNAADRTVQRVPRDSPYIFVGADGTLSRGDPVPSLVSGPQSAITDDFDRKGRVGSASQWEHDALSLRTMPVTLHDAASGRALLRTEPIRYQIKRLDRIPLTVGIRKFRVIGNEVRVLIDGRQQFSVRHASLVFGIAVDGQRKKFATGSHDSRVRVWDLASGALLHEFLDHRSAVRTVAFDDSGLRLASASTDRTVCVFDLDAGVRTHRFVSPRGPTALAFQPTGDHLYCLGVDELCAFDLGEQARLRLRPHVSRAEGNVYPYIYAVAHAPGAQELVSGGWDGSIAITDIASGALKRRHSARGRRVFDAAYLPDGAVVSVSADLESGADDGWLQIWDASGAVRVCRNLPDHLYVRAVPSPRGHTIAVAGYSGHAAIIDATDGRELHRWMQPVERRLNPEPSICYSADGKRVYVGGCTGLLQIFSSSLKLRKTLTISEFDIQSLTAHPTRSIIACGDRAGVIRILDARTGDVLQTLRGHAVSVYALAFHPDGTRLASGSDDNTIRLWDLGHGETVLTLSGHESYVYDLSWSPDGDTLISTGGDNSVRYWRTTRTPRNSAQPSGSRGSSPR